MKPPKMYLMKRPENGVWYFRRPIPKELRPFVLGHGKVTLTVSLKTKNLTEARLRHHECWMDSERLIENAKAQASAAASAATAVKLRGKGDSTNTAREAMAPRPFSEFSEAELETLIHRWFLARQAEALEKFRLIFNFGELDERKEALATLDRELAGWELRGESGNLRNAEVYRVCREILETAGGSVTFFKPVSAMFRWSKFVSLVRESLILLNRYSHGILQNGSPPSHESTSPELSASRLAASVRSVGTVRVRELIEKFENEPNRSHVKPKTRDEFKLVYQMLIEFVGSDTPVATVTREQIKQLQDVYRHLPPHSKMLYPGKTMREAAELAKKKGVAPMERATFNKRMSLVSSLFRYAVREQMIASSPAEGLTMKEARKVEGEKSFSVAQLNSILRGSIFTAFADEPGARVTPQHRLNPHEFWAPLIALFQGFRMEEILQLSPDDVCEQEGIHCIHVRDGEGQSLKTTATRRIVPLHPILEKLGFLRLVNAVRKAGLRELFPEAARGKTYGNRSHNYSKKFNRYLAQIGVKSGRNQVFHSFRHTFTDGLRMVEVPQDVRRRLGGWTDNTSLESSYGGRLIPYLAEQLAKLHYPGLDLSHLQSAQPTAPVCRVRR